VRTISCAAVLLVACASGPQEPPGAPDGQATSTAEETGGATPHDAHAGGPASCEELAKACHDVGHGDDDAGKCHQIGHAGDAESCDKERARCVSLCAEKAKHGAH